MLCELTWKLSSHFSSSGPTEENSREYLLDGQPPNGYLSFKLISKDAPHAWPSGLVGPRQIGPVLF